MSNKIKFLTFIAGATVKHTTGDVNCLNSQAGSFFFFFFFLIFLFCPLLCVCGKSFGWGSQGGHNNGFIFAPKVVLHVLRR